MKRRIGVVIILGLVMAGAALAAIPEKLSYQGVLTNASGVVVPNGNYNLTLSLYDTLSGGTALWTEAQTAGVTNGIFNVVLGSVTPISIAFDKPLYLGVAVAGGAELTPRSLLTPSPYSLNAPVMAFGGSDATTSLNATTWTNYAGDSFTLNCPGPGYVVVQSSVWMWYNHVSGEDVTFYVVHDTTATGAGPGWRYRSAFSILAAQPATSYTNTEIPVQTVFAIPSAGPYTFYLNGILTGTVTSAVNFYYASNVATWYPSTNPSPTMVAQGNSLKVFNKQAK